MLVGVGIEEVTWARRQLWPELRLAEREVVMSQEKRNPAFAICHQLDPRSTMPEREKGTGFERVYVV